MYIYCKFNYPVNYRPVIDALIKQLSCGGEWLGLPHQDERFPKGYKHELLSEGCVTVILSEEAPVRTEQFDVEALKEQMQKLQKALDRLPEESRERWPLREQLRKLEDTISNGGIVKSVLYGAFMPEPEPTVILYMGNIRKDRHPDFARDATLVHELYHAWNFFSSECSRRTVPAIDEAIVEYETLCFLDRISKAKDVIEDSWVRDYFNDVFKWQLNAVKDKQLSIGLLAAYGFGAYIFENDPQLELLRAYPPLSGKLSVSDPDVQEAVSLLTPIYPYDNEALALKHIIDALNKKHPANNRIHIQITLNTTTPSVMNSAERTLFWDIINCPDSSKESNPACPCFKVLSVQSPLPVRQVPEPWSGDLSKASFMVIGSNPALVVDAVKHRFEVFPSRDSNWKNWQTLSSTKGNSFTWDPSSVEDFFVNRFNGAVFPLTGTPYVDKARKTSLQYVAAKGIVPKRFNNDYWATYNEYCKAIDPTFVDYSFVVTDFVHCKSGGEIGYAEALAPCRGYIKRIFNLFLSNGQPNHSILLFGMGEKSAAEKLDVIKSIGAVPVGAPKIICNYLYKRKDVKNQNRVILMQEFSYGKIGVAVYYLIPAPSGNTKPFCSPLTFMGRDIEW